jgi:hypothetical protein
MEKQIEQHDVLIQEILSTQVLWSVHRSIYSNMNSINSWYM